MCVSGIGRCGVRGQRNEGRDDSSEHKVVSGGNLCKDRFGAFWVLEVGSFSSTHSVLWMMAQPACHHVILTTAQKRKSERVSTAKPFKNSRNRGTRRDIWDVESWMQWSSLIATLILGHFASIHAHSIFHTAFCGSISRQIHSRRWINSPPPLEVSYC